MRVLLIEDHQSMRTMVADHLRNRGFAVDAVEDGKGALAACAAEQYDAVILDLGLPDVDGAALLPSLRGVPATQPILVLTARDDLQERIALLNEGADDFIRKPFDLLELEARLRAVLRRPGARQEPRLAYGDVSFERSTRSATVGGVPLDLARREASILECLAERGGLPVTRETLERRLYGFEDTVTGNALEAAVSRLRRRLQMAGSSVRIEVVRGVGYRLSTAVRG